MVKLQPMERISHALGVSIVKLREAPNLFRLQTNHSEAPSTDSHRRSHLERFSDTLCYFNCNQKEF